jgi:hypothetical protein
MTTTVAITLPDFARRIRTLAPRMEREIVRGLRAGALRVRTAVAHAIATTTPHPPVDTELLAASFQIERLAQGARVESGVLHAEMIEVGRRPGPVPLAPILAWVRRKRLYENELQRILGERGERHRSERAILRDLTRGTSAARGEMSALRRRQRRDAVDEAAMRVAIAIRAKIQREGYAPRFPMRRALIASAPDVERAVLAVLDRMEP